MTPNTQSLDGRTLAIGVLSVTACILFVGFILVSTRPVQALGELDNGGDYKMATQQLTQSTEGIVVMDAAARRLIVYGFDFGKKELVPLSAFDLAHLRTPGENRGGGAPARRP